MKQYTHVKHGAYTWGQVGASEGGQRRHIENLVVVAADGQENDIDNVDDVDSDGNGVNNQ